MKNYEAHEIIYFEGEKVKSFFILSQGEVLLLKEAGGRLLPTHHLKSGDIFGEAAALALDQYPETAIALSPCEIENVLKSDCQKILRSCSSWLKDIISSLGTRVLGSLNFVGEHKITNKYIDVEDVFPTTIENKINKALKEMRTKKDD